MSVSEFKPFSVDRAKTSRASCKGCKGNCPTGELRLAKLVASPYGENQQMKSWHHVDCFMNALLKQRPATKRIDSIDDIDNWQTLSNEDQQFLLKKINEMEKQYAAKNCGKYTAKVIKNESAPQNNSIASLPVKAKESNDSKINLKTDDNNFQTFCSMCKKIKRVDAYTEKTATVNNFFRKGTDGDTFKGDLALWCKLLLPQVTKRVYNLKSKQLVKLFSRIFNITHDDMLTDLEQGDVAQTIKDYFTRSKTVQPATESTLTIHEVDSFLEELSTLTKEEEQTYHFKKIVKKCTLDDLLMLIRLIKGDLRINAGPKHILEGVHPDAYTVFQTSRDLNMVLDRVISDSSGVKHKDATQSTVQAKIVLMTPVLPMLAEACKSVEMAMKKCPNGMFSEIKYDGERVQVHKQGSTFKYYSRALKPVMSHKVSHFKDYLPKAFPEAVDMILDAEVLMVDMNTGKPLPFGTLGKHKQSAFKDAQVCLYVFDCLYYNGQVLIDVPIKKRRQILHDHMVEVKNHVMFSEQQLIEKPSDLAKMIAKVLQLGLEGLVLKDLNSKYEPGKRHWLKVKKDYLFDGAMADTADLVVLGAWFGTGKKGGMMSVFLMGCLDRKRRKWCTVTKVHTGHDDSTLKRLQEELTPLMVKISQDKYKIPSWLDCNNGMVPDFVALDPKKQPVWEITGTELTKANLHTADGISVRFPRVTRIRNDKDWESATDLDELRHLYETSKEKTDVSLLDKIAANASVTDEPPRKKIKESPSKNKIDSFLIKSSPKKQWKHEDDKSSTSSEIKSEKSDDSGFNEHCKLPKKLLPDDFTGTGTTKVNQHTAGRNKRKNGTSTDVDELRPLPENSKEKTDVSLLHKLEATASVTDEPPRKKVKDSTSNNKIDSFLIKSPPIKKLKHEDANSSTSSKTKSDTNVDSSSDDDANLDEVPASLKNPLPDAFKGLKLGFYPDFISFPEEERTHFERHWLAYGGIVVKSLKSIDVDYLVHNEDTIHFSNVQKLKRKLLPNVIHVNKYWLIKCINDVQLCDTAKYSVQIKP